MTRLAPLLCLLLVASSSPEDADGLLRRGNAAAARGDWGEAARLYESAQAWTLNPQHVAFNLATARYRLATRGESSRLALAEEAYRSCLAPGGAFRGRSLFGLGDCLLIRAVEAGTLDGAMLRSAIDRFTECLREADTDEELAARARHNRERARLLLLQVQPRPGDAPIDDPGPGGEDTREADPPPPGKEGSESAVGTEMVPIKEDGQGGLEGPKGGQGGAGEGGLPPVPNTGSDAPALGAGEATRHLERATQRILKEWRGHRRSQTRPAGAVRDW